jgi:hypothetical protein
MTFYEAVKYEGYSIGEEEPTEFTGGKEKQGVESYYLPFTIHCIFPVPSLVI